MTQIHSIPIKCLFFKQHQPGYKSINTRGGAQSDTEPLLRESANSADKQHNGCVMFGLKVW